MNPYVNLLVAHLNAQSLASGQSSPASMVEYLREAYTNDHPIDTDEIRRSINQLDKIFDALPFNESNLLFNVTFQLCEQYEQAAFLEGFRAGAQLILELLE